jgi:hypothetical protein
MMKACLSALLVVFVTVACAQSSRGFSSSPPSTSLHSLTEARIFALGPVGYAGTTSQEERLFKAIFALNRDKAKQELERLYFSENPQAMSYALVGMRKLDRKRYAELLVVARASNAAVTTMWGCVIEGEQLRKIANDLDSGQYSTWLRWMATISL